MRNNSKKKCYYSEFDKEYHNPKINQEEVKEIKEQKLKIMTIIIILMWVPYYIDNKLSKGLIIYSLIFFLVHVLRTPEE